jgi:carboxymethylenebutenolidase
MSITEEIIDTETVDGPMAVSVKYPDDGLRHPTIAVFHDGPGMRESNHEFNRRLAAEGYRVVMPDLYHRHGRMLGWESSDATDETRAQVMKMLHSLTDDNIQSDLDDALAVIDLNPDEKLGVIGFCLGARAIYRTLMRLPDRFVCGATWHPSFLADDTPDSPHLTASQLRQPVYIGIGTADEIQSIAMHQRFFDAVAALDNVEVEIFDGADHGYTWPSHPNYHDHAATTSWAKTTALFNANLS